MDIILHCLDPGHLKAKPLSEVFPAVCRFNQVRTRVPELYVGRSVHLRILTSYISGQSLYGNTQDSCRRPGWTIGALRTTR